jgi:hypothetical protein
MQHRQPAALLGLSALAACALACQAIGDDTPANLGSTETPQVASPPPVEPFATEMSDFFGRWVGVAEDALAFAEQPGAAPGPYRFPSGSTRIVLELFDMGAGAGGGTLTFGDGSPPPPAVGPDVGYPIGTDYAALLRYPVEGAPSFTGALPSLRGQLPPHEGFPYFLYREDLSPFSQVPDGLLRMRYSVNGVFGDWCALQTSHPNPNIGFSCNAGAPVDDLERGGCELLSFPVVTCDENGCEVDPSPLEELGPVDCNKAFLCDDAAPRCDCSESGCSISLATNQAELVVRRVGNELVGTIGGAAFLNERHARTSLGTIRFQREP